MQRIIASILMVTFLVAGFEIAIDLEEALEGESVSLSTNHQLGEDDNSGESSDCDHCCHASAHYAGALLACSVIAQITHSIIVELPSSAYQFPAAAPPIPPPIA